MISNSICRLATDHIGGFHQFRRDRSLIAEYLVSQEYPVSQSRPTAGSHKVVRTNHSRSLAGLCCPTGRGSSACHPRASTAARALNARSISLYGSVSPQYPHHYPTTGSLNARSSPPFHPLNFGITSVANALSCSSMTAFGVPMLMLTFTCSSPGYRDSISLRYAVSSSGGPANHAPFFM